MTFVLYRLSHYNSIIEPHAQFLLSLLEHLTIDFPSHFILSIIDVHLDSASRDKFIFPSAIMRILRHFSIPFPSSDHFTVMCAINYATIKHSEWRKIWFCIPYKTHSESNKHGSILFMIDNMHYVIFRIWEQDRVPWCDEIQNKRLEVLRNTFNLHSNSTLRPWSVVSQ